MTENLFDLKPELEEIKKNISLEHTKRKNLS